MAVFRDVEVRKGLDGLTTYFKNLKTQKCAVIYELFMVSVDDPCLKIVSERLELPLEDILKALEKHAE